MQIMGSVLSVFLFGKEPTSDNQKTVGYYPAGLLSVASGRTGPMDDAADPARQGVERHPLEGKPRRPVLHGRVLGFCHYAGGVVEP